MFFKFNYGLYPVQNCSLKLVEMQSKMYLSLTTLTGANLANEEIGQWSEEGKTGMAKDFMFLLTKFVNGQDVHSKVIDLDLFLKEYKND